ncbi:MAG: hypothetical protein LKJ25_09480 [Clostridia bacterium]|jgi:cell division protein FtsB|nr:hypothetical protein [Clostridia bacterium]
MDKQSRARINSSNYYNYTSNAYDYNYDDRKEFIEKEREERRAEAILKRAAKIHRMKLFVSVVVVFVGSLATMSSYATVAKQRVINEKEADSLNSLKNANDTLQGQISDSADLAYIEKEAKGKLGMREPQSYQIVYIDVPKQSYTVQYNDNKKMQNDDFNLKKFAHIFKESVLNILK